MVFGLKNGLTFEGQYILSTMTDNALDGNGGSLPLRVNVNSIENTQSSDGRHGNNFPNNHTQSGNTQLRTPMRVQVEYPDSISRKRRQQSISDQPLKKFNPNSNSIIEHFEQNCLDDDELLSQVVDFPMNDVPSVSGVNDGQLTLGLSDTGLVFARCLTLPVVEKSPKKGKVIVYDSDGLGSESE